MLYNIWKHFISRISGERTSTRVRTANHEADDGQLSVRAAPEKRQEPQRQKDEDGCRRRRQQRRPRQPNQLEPDPALPGS